MDDLPYVAEESMKDLREFVETEEQLVKEEHDFGIKLYQWDALLMHLDETLPEDAKHLHALSSDVSDILGELRDMVGVDEGNTIKIIAEEKSVLEKLKKNQEHRNWTAIKEFEGNTIRLEIKELRELHAKMIELMRLIKESNLIEAIKEDLLQNTKYEKEEEKIFLSIYKFIRAYERIIRHFIRKEKALS